MKKLSNGEMFRCCGNDGSSSSGGIADSVVREIVAKMNERLLNAGAGPENLPQGFKATIGNISNAEIPFGTLLSAFAGLVGASLAPHTYTWNYGREDFLLDCDNFTGLTETLTDLANINYLRICRHRGLALQVFLRSPCRVHRVQ